MIVTEQIAEHILQVFEGDNWTDISISEILKNINLKQAQQQTQGSPNTIASLLHHLCYWNYVIMQRLQGNNPVVPETNGYDVGELKNENDWNYLKEKTYQSFMQLSKAAQDFPEEKLNETYAAGKSSYYKNLQGIVEHAHYHLGQMVVIKNLIFS